MTLAAGVSSATVTVTPIDDPTAEATETVTLTLAAGSLYALGTPARRPARSSTTTPTSSPSRSSNDAGAEQGTVPIVFTVNRMGALTGTIAIPLAWSGTAKLGTDYTVSATSGDALGHHQPRADARARASRARR